MKSRPLPFPAFALLLLAVGVAGAPLSADVGRVFALPAVVNGQPIGRYLTLLEDRAANLQTQDVARRTADFAPSKKDAPSFGFSPSAHWASLRISNPDPVARTVALVLAVPSMDSAVLTCSGSTLCRSQEAGDHSSFSSRPFRHRHPTFLLQLGPGETGDYLLRLQSTGAVAFRLQVWDPSLLEREVEGERLLFGLYYGLMLAMLIYNSFLLIAVRDRAYLFYSLFILAFSLLQASIDGNAFVYLWPNIGRWGDLTVPGFGYVMAIVATQFTRVFIDTPKYAAFIDRLMLAFIVVCALGLGVLGASAALQMRVLVFPSNVAMLLGIALGLTSSGMAIHRGSRPAIFYLVGWAGFMFGSMALILRNVGVLPNFAVLDWSTQIGSAALVMLLSLGLADLINTMRRKLAAYNVELEREVGERTRDLNQSLDEVRRLHYKQIGDYYLISLLSNPLSANRGLETHLRAESLVRQHKRFSFKDRESEIGGDLCITDRLQLADAQYLVFLNADAMGKSIQGAGGSIVIGAVFSTLLERTRYSVDMKSHSPERWLHYAYKELDRVFFSFGGNMLVSCVMGLIEERTNCLYFINAEHPAPVLLRGDSARFIPAETFHPRLGAGMQDLERCPISVLALQPADILITGSDGRDDIRVLRDGQPEINSDEQRFLAVVEEARGDLTQCVEILKKDGEFTDDLSLVRIAVPEDGPLLESPEGLRALRRKASELAGAKEYEEAGQVLLKLVESDPSVTEHLHTASACLKRAGRLSEAADLAERFFLRAPGDLRGMLNLSEIHIRLGNKERARKIVKLIRTAAPDHAKLTRLEEALGLT